LAPSRSSGAWEKKMILRFLVLSSLPFSCFLGGGLSSGIRFCLFFGAPPALLLPGPRLFSWGGGGRILWHHPGASWPASFLAPAGGGGGLGAGKKVFGPGAGGEQSSLGGFLGRTGLTQGFLLSPFGFGRYSLFRFRTPAPKKTPFYFHNSFVYSSRDSSLGRSFGGEKKLVLLDFHSMSFPPWGESLGPPRFLAKKWGGPRSPACFGLAVGIAPHDKIPPNPRSFEGPVVEPFTIGRGGREVVVQKHFFCGIFPFEKRWPGNGGGVGRRRNIKTANRGKPFSGRDTPCSPRLIHFHVAKTTSLTTFNVVCDLPATTKQPARLWAVADW